MTMENHHFEREIHLQMVAYKIDMLVFRGGRVSELYEIGQTIV